MSSLCIVLILTGGLTDTVGVEEVIHLFRMHDLLAVGRKFNIGGVSKMTSFRLIINYIRNAFSLPLMQISCVI